MISYFKSLSSKVALGGAEDAIDEASIYIASNPAEEFMICKMSKMLFEQKIAGLNISLDDDLLSNDNYNPNFHRVAHNIKQQCSRNYRKDTAEYIASSLAMAGCSILGSSPDIPKRERVWLQLQEMWKI